MLDLILLVVVVGGALFIVEAVFAGGAEWWENRAKRSKYKSVDELVSKPGQKSKSTQRPSREVSPESNEPIEP